MIIKYEDVVEWLGEDNTLEDTIGMIADIANGAYEVETLKDDILSYKEHQ